MKLKGLLVLALLCVALSLQVSANSYLYNAEGNSVSAPDAFTISEVHDGFFDAVGKLKNPSDIYVTQNGDIAIADTGNDRVVIFDKSWRHKRTIQQLIQDGNNEAHTLMSPKGVFIDKHGIVYVADTGNNRVIAIDEQDVIIREMTQENVPAINENMQFNPEKVVVDTDGNVYVVDRAVYQGIMQYDYDGKFAGFYAPNEVEVTAGVLFVEMWKNLLGQDNADALKKSLPLPYTNLYIDQENFVYTTATGVPVGSELKRLNALGINVFRTVDSKICPYGDLELSYSNDSVISSRFVDVHADQNGLVGIVDERQGRIFVYNQGVDLVAIMDTGIRSITAIDKIGEDYLVLDGDRGSVSVMAPTPYMMDGIEALSYYNKGEYTNSVSMWQDILGQNAHLDVAYRSIGRAYFQTGNSRLALNMLKKGDDPYFYSLALKDYRKEFVRENFVWLLLTAIVILVGMIIGLKHLRRWLSADNRRTGCNHV